MFLFFLIFGGSHDSSSDPCECRRRVSALAADKAKAVRRGSSRGERETVLYLKTSFSFKRTTPADVSDSRLMHKRKPAKPQHEPAHAVREPKAARI